MSLLLSSEESSRSSIAFGWLWIWSKKVAGDEGGGAEWMPDAKLSIEILTSSGKGK
jgi:hypothetical protein